MTVYVRHVPRMSDDLADLADKISRKDSDFSGKGRRILQKALFRCTGSVLSDRLVNPGKTESRSSANQRAEGKIS